MAPTGVLLGPPPPPPPLLLLLLLLLLGSGVEAGVEIALPVGSVATGEPASMDFELEEAKLEEGRLEEGLVLVVGPGLLEVLLLTNKALKASLVHRTCSRPLHIRVNETILGRGMHHPRNLGTLTHYRTTP